MWPTENFVYVYERKRIRVDIRIRIRILIFQGILIFKYAGYIPLKTRPKSGCNDRSNYGGREVLDTVMRHLKGAVSWEIS